MNKEAIMINNVSFEDYRNDMSRIEAKIDDLKKCISPKAQEDYMSRRDVAEFFKCDLSSIYLWSKAGKLKPYNIGNRVYFKRSEVEGALKAVVR
ncbi:MAG TPA: helix-turn-helix domain-containing protein [Bacteroidia bacterium]|jgi:hypothetical protein|nr:helix-turn-helix domain-containing protein [Bacteroidia bacterium]